jgi:hypothetical protein
MMSATVAGTTFRPTRSYTTLWDATEPAARNLEIAVDGASCDP